jgi:hypothetical protein
MHRFLFLGAAVAAAALAQPAVLTAQYDNSRSGANVGETVLTPRNVNTESFGKRFAMTVDGDVHAQPLYVPRLDIPGKGVHDVVFVATERDSVYAFDAAAEGPPLWHVSFLEAGVNPAGWIEVGCSFLGQDVGITATPVIDLTARTLYLVARTSERSAGGEDLLYQRLHALDLATGAERPGSPVLIRASVPVPALLGVWPREVRFHAARENPRAALLLANRTVYIAFGSACDVRPYYGWVLAYDARTLQQKGAFNTAPDAGESGIWQSGTGIAADRDGNVYAVTGNGRFTASQPGARDYGDSVLKLGFDGGALKLRDYFTPFDEASLNRRDEDLGSCGPVLLPDQPGAHPHLLVATGKPGVMYLLDRDGMGKYQAGSDRCAVQSLRVAPAAYGAPAWWNGHLYFFGGEDALKEFAVVGGRMATAPAHHGSTRFQSPGAIPSVSANGNRDGIVWVVLAKPYAERREVPAILQAYDAEDVSRLLYTTEHDALNMPGPAVRLTIPMVANGRVYLAGRSAVSVYGLTAARQKRR